MAEVTAALVKELRDRTGAGMMDCKRALGDTSGDVEAAVDWLRKKGLAAAAKKSGRIAADGLVGVATRGLAGAVVEVNSETDFVARNELFQAFVRTLAGLAVGASGDVEALKAAPYPGTGRTVASEPSCASRRDRAARRRRSSSAWSKAGCANSTRRRCCWSRSS